MLYCIDKLLILFIYTCVLTTKSLIFGMILNKVIASLLLFFYFVYFLGNKKNIAISRGTLCYIYISFLMIAILVGIGLLKGNDFENIINFITPLFILLIIPALVSVIKVYGTERYLHHVLNAIGFLSFCVLIIFVFSINNRNFGFSINQYFSLFAVSYPEIGIRIHAVTGAFYPAGLLLSYYFILKNRGIKYYLLFLLIAFALYVYQSYSVYAAAFISFCAYVFIFKGKVIFKKIIIFTLIIIGLILFFGNVPMSMQKKGSADIKAEQTINCLNIFRDEPLLGRGLGYVYHDIDTRHKDAVILEVSYMAILASTGIIGSLFYAFIYLYYPVKFVFQKKTNMAVSPVFFSCLSILIAGVGNPYIWSGCMGFFFIIFLAAMIDAERLRYA